MHERRRHSRRSLPGFTLTELLVAVVVLLVIILAVGRIFGTASEVVKNGEATANILQEAAAVEQLMRNDLARISDDGFLVVQCVAVRNNVSGQLLDPSLPADHIFRCDQIAFIADDLAVSRQTQSMGQFTEPGRYGALQPGETLDYQTGNGLYSQARTLPTPQSTSSFVYYGHGVQFPYLPPNLGSAVDPLWPSAGGRVIQPWFRPAPGADLIELQRWPGEQAVPGGEIYNGAQPPARNWSLARQETLLADDYDGSASHFHSRVLASGLYRNAAEFLYGNDGSGTFRFNDAMAAGRVDVASTDIGRLRDAYRLGGPGAVANALLNYRPRAEKRPPTLDRSDVLLTTNVLGSNCSSITVDWTWSEGVGRELDLDLDPARNLAGAIRGVSHRGGVRPPIGGESGTITEYSEAMPWFGMSDLYGNPNAGVAPAQDYFNAPGPFASSPVRFHAPIAYDPRNQIWGGGPGGASQPFGPGSTTVPTVLPTIEGAGVVEAGPGIWVYRAVFGLNGHEPFLRDGENRPLTTAASGGGVPWPIYRSDYTPRPSALRITATFHDPQNAIEGGRTLQFTIPLPERVQDLPEG